MNNDISASSHPTSQIAACPECDLLYTDVTIGQDERLRCSRCEAKLSSTIPNSLSKTLALSLTGLLLFIPAMTFPLISISILNIEGKSSVFESILILLKTGYPFVGSMVFIVSLLFPLLKLSLLFWLSCSLHLNKKNRYLKYILRAYNHLDEWAMAEVYMLGIFLSIIKLQSMGRLDFNLGFFCFCSLSLVTVASSAVKDDKAFWRLIDSRSKGTSPMLKSRVGLTAREAGIIRCHECSLLVSAIPSAKNTRLRCPRCMASIHTRKPGSINKTWALIICSFILFIPANLLPIMRVDYFGRPEITTIMDGIVYFFKDGDYLIGTIIFMASILVPLFKIIGVVVILLSIQFGWQNWLLHKTKMFRFVHFIGRWSFLDIFVIALLTSMIQFGALSSIAASPAARYFTAVVITTMFAAIVLDPRILWDSCINSTHINEEKNG